MFCLKFHSFFILYKNAGPPLFNMSCLEQEYLLKIEVVNVEYFMYNERYRNVPGGTDKGFGRKKGMRVCSDVLQR